MTASFAIPYDLDFDVRYTPAPLWSTGADVFVGIDLAQELTPDSLEELDALMLSFEMLANTGGLGGHAIEPVRSGIADRAAGRGHGRHQSFILRSCRLDERATILCANALSQIQPRAPIRAVRIASDSAFESATERLLHDMKQPDPYPELFDPLPFALDFDPDLESPTLELSFADDVTDDDFASIEDRLLTWGAACASGIFAAPMAPPADCSMALDPADLLHYDDIVEWTVSSFRCHEAALRALVNACVKLHADVPLQRITLS